MAVAFRDRAGLADRHREREVLDALLAAVRAGQSRSLVIRGEGGVGKTALLDYVARQASGCQVLRAAGVESEMELPFAGLHQLCAPALDRLDRLPGPQRDALAVAFGIVAGDPPNRFLVGLAVLSLLSEVARARPWVCLIDDTQWLDQVSAQTLAFVARRLLAESVGLVFAVREPSEGPDLGGLPDLRLDGLDRANARLLLDSSIKGPLDERLRDRIVEETRGNPLALLELPHGLTPAELAGGFGLPYAGPLVGRIEESFLRRLGQLPPESQLLMLLAAAEPVGDIALIWRAARQLGLGPDAIAPAEATGLVGLNGALRFRHPLVRSAAYRMADAEARRAAHRALADATDPMVDPDRRAWHLAHASLGFDEEVARELVRSADRAQGRGGISAAAAFLARATHLTPDPADRGERALAAAQAKFEAAATDAVEELLGVAEAGPLDGLQQARVARLRAQIVFARRRGNDAAPLLLDAARRLDALDAGLARETYMDAFAAAMYAGRLSGEVGAREVAEAARAAPRGQQPPQPIELLVDGMAARYVDGDVAAVPILARALRALISEDGRQHDDLRWLWLTNPVAFEVWDDEAWDRLTARAVTVARGSGALAALRVALAYRAGVIVHMGDFAAGSALLEESDAISAAAGLEPVGKYVWQVLAAWGGDEGRTLQLVETDVKDAMLKGEGRLICMAGFVTALLYNGLGRYDAALAGARRACEHDDLGLFGWALAELVEAGVRSGDRKAAIEALSRLEQQTMAAGTDWGLGILARSRALLSDGRDAEGSYVEAIERLGRSRVTIHLARANLVYGEWLRRENRRQEARDHLRIAHERLHGMGAEAFAERARRELLATGETVRKRSAGTLDALTPQEHQVARLAADGHTNSEIGSQLFISPRTAEYHLHKVYTKLGVTSRRSLRAALADAPLTAGAASTAAADGPRRP
jgi:DNA-binding CsgD family transcriptional regulator